MTDRRDWNEDSIDERIRAVAAGYRRRDGTVPRDEMWAAIAPAWRAAQTTPAVITLPRRTHATRWRWSPALAAGLLLGIALDRGVVSYRQRGGVAVGRTPRDVGRVPGRHDDATARADSLVRSPSTTPVASGAAPVQRVADGAAPREHGPRETARAASPLDRPPSPSATPTDATAQRLYHAAALQTLAQAEALLTSYRTGAAADAESMRLAARWARDVLSSTRLLLDSPAGRDAPLRALLTDLELVLAQIVQRSGAPLDASERDLIERAMRDRDLLPRLRSVVPPGVIASD